MLHKCKIIMSVTVQPVAVEGGIFEGQGERGREGPATRLRLDHEVTSSASVGKEAICYWAERKRGRHGIQQIAASCGCQLEAKGVKGKGRWIQSRADVCVLGSYSASKGPSGCRSAVPRLATMLQLPCINIV